MMLSVDQMLQIVANGGGLRIANDGLSQQNLIQLAAHAGGSGAKLTIVVDLDMTHDQMVEIAAQGRGNVVFDLVERR
jgi:hypothetical protein